MRPPPMLPFSCGQNTMLAAQPQRRGNLTGIRGHLPGQADNGCPMSSIDANQALAGVFAELADGPQVAGDAVVLNSGDLGLVRSLAKLSAADASQSTDGGATIAAHAQHLRFGLSLLNRWAREGGDPFI